MNILKLFRKRSETVNSYRNDISSEIVMNILKEEITNFYGEFKGLQIDPNAILVSLIVSGKTTTIPPKTTTVTTYNMIFS